MLYKDIPYTLFFADPKGSSLAIIGQAIAPDRTATDRHYAVGEGVFTEPVLAPEPKLVQFPYCANVKHFFPRWGCGRFFGPSHPL